MSKDKAKTKPNIRMADKRSRKTIKITNRYLEKITMFQQSPMGLQRVYVPAFQALLDGYFPGKSGWWISRSLDKIEGLSKAYIRGKEKIIEAHAEHHEADIKGPDPRHKGPGAPKEIVIHKKGGIKLQPNGLNPVIKDIAAFEEAIADLQEIENDLKIYRVPYDPDEVDAYRDRLGKPRVSNAENILLIPIVEELEQ